MEVRGKKKRFNVDAIRDQEQHQLAKHPVGLSTLHPGFWSASGFLRSWWPRKRGITGLLHSISYKFHNTAPPYNYCQDCLMIDPSETPSTVGEYKIKLHLMCMYFFEIVTSRIHQALVWWTDEQEETTTIEERIWDATVQDAKRPFGAGLLGRLSNRKWENIQWVENPTTGMRCSRVYHWCGFLQDHLCPITALLLIFSTHPVPT